MPRAGRARAVVDWCVGAGVRSGRIRSADVLRARVLAGGSASGVVVCFVFFVHRLVIDGGFGAGAATMMASGLVFCAPAIMLRVGVSFRVAAAVVPSALLLLLPFDAYQNGGLASASLTAMLPVPLMAGFFLGARASLGFAGLLGVETLALAALPALGIRVPLPPDPAQAASAHAVAVIALLAFIGALTSLFDRERAVALEQVARSEHRYELAAKETNDGFFEWTPGRGAVLSERFLELLGLAVGRPALSNDELAAAIHDDERDGVLATFADCLARRPAPPMQFRLRRADGTLRWVDARARRVETARGEPPSLIGTVRDVTAQKRLDELKSDFVSAVSHELRTPLTSIRGSVALLEGGAAGPLSPRAQEVLAIASRNAQRLIQIVDELLDIQTLEAGRFQPVLTSVDMNEVAGDVASANMARCAAAGVTLEVILPGTPSTVQGDAPRLVQVLEHLLSNALRFSPSGALLRVVVQGDAREVRVEIIDQGPGIPEAFRERIFQKFAQAGSGDSRREQGTGLGLAISKAVVERLGGSIGYEDVAPHGARFAFVLPRRTEARSAGPPREGGLE
ncbi:hypothetical protein BH11MYX4_BH11MYX4_23030 [soil metagenome]